MKISIKRLLQLRRDKTYSTRRYCNRLFFYYVQCFCFIFAFFFILIAICLYFHCCFKSHFSVFLCYFSVFIAFSIFITLYSLFPFLSLFHCVFCCCCFFYLFSLLFIPTFFHIFPYIFITFHHFSRIVIRRPEAICTSVTALWDTSLSLLKFGIRQCYICLV